MSRKSEKGPETQMTREEEIRLAAYYLWEARGCRNGCDVEDWLEAEQGLEK